MAARRHAEDQRIGVCLCHQNLAYLRHFAAAFCDISFQPEDASGQLDYRYDEFGFKVEEEGERRSSVESEYACIEVVSLSLLVLYLHFRRSRGAFEQAAEHAVRGGIARPLQVDRASRVHAEQRRQRPDVGQGEISRKAHHM